MKENLDLIFQSMNSETIMYSVIISIVLALALTITGLYFKKKKKDWWLIVSLLGITGVVINGVKLIQLTIS